MFDFERLEFFVNNSYPNSRPHVDKNDVAFTFEENIKVTNFASSIISYKVTITQEISIVVPRVWSASSIFFLINDKIGLKNKLHKSEKLNR